MTHSKDRVDSPSAERTAGNSKTPTPERNATQGRSSPSFSFVLFMLAVTVAGSGGLAWALVRPEHRAVEFIVPTPGPLVVHVTGPVFNPGVYSLPPGSRVADAISAAGGLTDVDLNINLAAPLRDGQRLAVTGDVPVVAGETAVTGDPVVLLDLNTASLDQLVELRNIGPERAEAIIDFRERNGPILFVDDLMAIDGIGPAIAETLRPLVIQP